MKDKTKEIARIGRRRNKFRRLHSSAELGKEEDDDSIDKLATPTQLTQTESQFTRGQSASIRKIGQVGLG